MKKNWKLLIWGVTVLFWMQSCVVVRKARRHPHPHHRHCMVVSRQTIDTTLFNMPATYTAPDFAMVYEHK